MEAKVEEKKDGRLEFDLNQPDLFGLEQSRVKIKKTGPMIEVEIGKNKIQLTAKAWAKVNAGIKLVQ